MGSGVRVIIVEDDQDLRESLVECLALSGYEVQGVGSSLEFYRALTESSYTIAVVDLGLPDQCGYVLTEHISQKTAMGVIILTARDAVEDKVRGYDAGADVYMVKPVDCRELAAAIASLAQRLGPRDAVTLDEPRPAPWQLVRQDWRLIAPGGAVILLTAKEMQFMECLAESAERAARREAILAALGYRDDEYASRAVDSLVRRLRRKIEGEGEQSSPIKTVHGVGYCFAAPLAIL